MSTFAALTTWQLIGLPERDRPPASDSGSAATTAQTFEEVYRDHHRDVYRYVLLSLCRRAEADDVVADTFDRAFAAWRTGRGGTSSRASSARLIR